LERVFNHIIIAYNLWLLVVQVENQSYYVALALPKVICKRHREC
jgi:hypothetical protein